VGALLFASLVYMASELWNSGVSVVIVILSSVSRIIVGFDVSLEDITIRLRSEFNPEDGVTVFIRNVGLQLQGCTKKQATRPYRSAIGVLQHIGVPVHGIRRATNFYYKLYLNISTFAALNLLGYMSKLNV
jgi:hypothetical protein